jgi:hypothetical protein
MKIGTKLLAVVLAPVLFVAVVATNLQQVYAQIDPGNFVLWKKTTHEFEKNVIKAIGDPNVSPGPRELLVAYIDDVNRIFLGGPDTIPALLQSYQEDVTTIFDQNPPDPDKQIKDFRAITHDFVKGVTGAINPPEPETPA